MTKKGKNKSNNAVKTISFMVIVTLLITGFLPIIQTGISKENNNEAAVTINVNTTSNNEEITMTYEVFDYNKEIISHNDMDYYLYSIGEESNILKQGYPDLPAVHRSIIVPDDKQMTVEVLDVTYEVYEGIDVIPSKGEISRIINPDDVAYMFDDIYTKDVWYPESFAQIHDPYILRDFRGLVVQMNPIQYNPVQHKIRIVSEITVKISAYGPGIINVIDREKPIEVLSEQYDYIYDHHFMNYAEYLSNERYTPVSDQGTMVVICYDDFYAEMIPFVQWKNMKGQYTEIINFSEIGTTANDIDAYIENYYNTDGLTFVLLVGDSAQIPTLSASGGESDVSYSYISSDYYSDLFIGRFSAENTDHVLTQVERTIEYEKYPLEGGDWYHKGLGVASNQGPGDEGEYDDEHIDIIRDKLLAYTYTEVEQSYDGSGGSSTIIANAVDAGLSVINYCGHGSTTSWGNGGGFSNSNVNNLVNDNMLPFITSVACVVGNFGGQTCFCEAWLRATNNGEPTGAVAHFGSSINQDWNEPMDGQDEFNDILVESYADNIKRTFGGLAFNGVMHMLDEYPSAGTDDASTWHIFGDPSVEVRTDTPTALSVTHAAAISSTAESFDVTVTGVENALCTLSYNGVIIGTDYTDASGNALIQIDEFPTGASELDLVVTAYNKIPYITTINLLTTEPYLMFNPSSYNAGTVLPGDTDQTTFSIWNGNVGTLTYTLAETSSWVDVSPTSGSSTGEADTITIDIDTLGLSLGLHTCEISISSNGGEGVFQVSVYISDGSEQLDIEQDIFARGFPIRHAADGDWAGAQSFSPTINTITRAEIYMRKFGNPEFDLVVELREGSIDGPLLDTLTFTPGEIVSTWGWVVLDFDDVTSTLGGNYFIICPPAPSGVTTSFGYEWGYAYGDQYPDGSFWFTRDGGALWRDLPSSYEFSFRTYGTN